MQIYTDLKDKTGEKILSNHILMVEISDEKDIGNVSFEKGSFKWRSQLLSEVNNFAVIIGKTGDPDSHADWFFGLDKYNEARRGITYPEDSNRIKSILSDLGADYSLDECQDLWIDYSSSLMAGWLYLPKKDIDLTEILKKFTKK